MNNPALYDAAYSGAIGGASQRWITSTSETGYSSLVNAAIAFAVAVDAEIPPVGGEGPSDAESDLLLAICLGFWSSRNPTSTNSNDYLKAAQAVATLYAEARVELS
jgi:hypothetical protein